MLSLLISGERRWDEDKEEFIPASKDYILQMEHSLLSIAKWEAKYHKPYLSTNKDLEMTRYYAKCMTINTVPDDVFERLSAGNIDEIANYISDNYTATWFSDGKNKVQPHANGRMNGEIITAELVYYWMIKMNIPIEFQKWHFNRLLTLIKVISIKDDPKGNATTTKMSASERRALNKARQAKYHTRG